MFQDRKEYRKKFTSTGVIHLAGEDLEFTSYDVSVKGMRIELIPGGLMSMASDVSAMMKEITVAEIFVKELMLTGEVDIAWVNSENGKIIMGLEFRDVIYNAHKLWRKRKYFRKKVHERGHLILSDAILNFVCVDFSVEGMCLQMEDIGAVKVGNVVKLVSEGRGVKAMAKIIWIMDDDRGAKLGLRYLQIE